ncbi:neuropeptide capa receptor, putative [Ixodes scapularis]|uniref:Neuropeptide capa receptor, putative n=1 Tax=Ixodes scapularis TaxID=6945 RepID=B7QBN4_IXOSC|nr:neuropeptide capa receptor, putative [Ixodes scapularis]|eukprot:XP_002412948.1 neuropeptide capa receptor, putative [Ixodes scapularis]
MNDELPMCASVFEKSGKSSREDGLPNDLKLYWQQYPWRLGETLCRLRALVAEAPSYASVLTIVAFTVERYVAIYHPLFLQTTSSLTRAVRIIAIIW